MLGTASSQVDQLTIIYLLCSTLVALLVVIGYVVKARPWLEERRRARVLDDLNHDGISEGEAVKLGVKPLEPAMTRLTRVESLAADTHADIQELVQNQRVMGAFVVDVAKKVQTLTTNGGQSSYDLLRSVAAKLGIEVKDPEAPSLPPELEALEAQFRNGVDDDSAQT